MKEMGFNKNKIFCSTIGLAAFLLTTALFLGGCGEKGTVSQVHIESVLTGNESDGAEALTNSNASLSVPTQITQIGSEYFIVDCYNDQILYNDNLSDPVSDWKVMCGSISRGHTLASDGTVYLADDTENNRVLVFEKIDGQFVNTQLFTDIGIRPHFIVYDEDDASFYAWSSMTGQMYVFKYDENRRVYISRIMTLDSLNDVYVRSFTIEGDSIYLVSGAGSILIVDKYEFRVKKEYKVPDSMYGMVQIMPVEKGYYITISTDVTGNQDYATIIYTEKLENLDSGDYTDIYSYFEGGGTPYYMGRIGDRYYLTEHRLPGHSVWAFDIGEDGMPCNVEAVY